MDTNTELERRVRILCITPACLVLWMKEGTETHFKVTGNGLPTDAVATGAAYDRERDRFCLTIRSASFEVVELGEIIPRHPDVEFTKIQ